jgi:ribosomal protein L34E
MPRKKATPPQTEPQSPWIELVAQPLKQIPNSYDCYLCNNYLRGSSRDPMEIRAACYVVTPFPDGSVHREAVGCLCSHCLQRAFTDTPEQYRERTMHILGELHKRLRRAEQFRDYEIRLPSEAAWMVETVEDIAGTAQTLTDLVIATGLSREEVVSRLIRQAKPEDLGSNIT